MNRSAIPSGLLTGLIVLAVGQASAAFEVRTLSPRGAALGGAATVLAGDAWSVLGNPSQMALRRGSTAAACWTPGLYGIQELPHCAVAAILPGPWGAAGLSVGVLGSSLYRETSAALAVSARASSTLSIGASFDVYLLSIRGYGSSMTVGATAGMSVELTDRISYGCTLSNLTGSTIGNCRERLPEVLMTGVNYRVGRGCSLIVELHKDIRWPPEFSAGIEYTPVDAFAIRAGAASEPTTVSGGFSVRWGELIVDYALVSHPQLGLTHHMSVAVCPGQR